MWVTSHQTRSLPVRVSAHARHCHNVRPRACPRATSTGLGNGAVFEFNHPQLIPANGSTAAERALALPAGLLVAASLRHKCVSATVTALMLRALPLHSFFVFLFWFSFFFFSILYLSNHVFVCYARTVVPKIRPKPKPQPEHRAVGGRK